MSENVIPVLLRGLPLIGLFFFFILKSIRLVLIYVNQNKVDLNIYKKKKKEFYVLIFNRLKKFVENITAQ